MSDDCFNQVVPSPSFILLRDLESKCNVIVSILLCAKKEGRQSLGGPPNNVVFN
jgi:hypothetical protein